LPGRSLALLVALALVVTGCASGVPPVASGSASGLAASPSAPPSIVATASPGADRLDLGAGVRIGVSIEWATDTPATVTARLGRTPAAWVGFVAFPFGPADRGNLAAFLDAVAAGHGTALLTLEPNAGLAAVDDAAIAELVSTLRGANDRGIAVLVRFAHEMNGSWYAWGQQPAAYVDAFRRVSAAVHAGTTRSAMLWAPNDGGGYPFPGSPHEAKPGTPDFQALDTNHDGRLSMADDPYAPYYPGDAAVDWVGMSLYHWGDHWPWGKNVVPEAGKFAAKLHGTYDGAAGDERSVPDFYATYAAGHGKPMAIPETAAFYRPAATDGAGELRIKQAWWREVFSPATLAEFPRIRLIDWFEQRKFETEVSDVVDWRVDASPTLTAAFLADLPPGFTWGGH